MDQVNFWKRINSRTANSTFGGTVCNKTEAKRLLNRIKERLKMKKKT